MAIYYWVGGSRNWDNTDKTHWAIVSGGAGGNGPPTSADAVNFDGSSGTGTCTTTNTAAAAAITLNSSTLSLTLGANITLSSSFGLSLGTLSLGSYTLSTRYFASNVSATRVINFGTGNITVTGNSLTVWGMNNGTGFSYTGTPTVNCTYSGSTGTRTITTVTSGNTTAPNFNITAGTDTVTFTAGSGYYANNIDFTGFAGTLTQLPRNIFGNLTIPVGMTTTITPSVSYFTGTGARTIDINGATLATNIIFDVDRDWET